MRRNRNHAPILRLALLLLLLTAATSVATRSLAQQPAEPAGKVALDASAAQPRTLEATTEQAIVRDYSRAWQALARALEHNSPGALDAGFVGVARDQLAARIEGQRDSGLRTRYTSKGHKLEAIFYSPEGSAMQLRDTAELELEVLDGNTVVHREDVTLRYIVLMTVAEANWKVRVLQEVAEF
jgi:hypothetical protein